MKRTAFWLAALVLVVGTTAHAQQQVQIQQQQIRQPAPEGPARDRPAGQTGTAVIRGRVFATDTGRPLRRAKITLSAQELGQDGRTTSTGPDGRYEFKDLPTARYSISVTRAGYLQLRYGQRRPLEQGKPLQVLDKQLVDNVDFSLPRMSIITGRVLDETNEPLAGALIMAMRQEFFEGQRRLVPVSSMQSDDGGQYRILGLVPGSYVVMATMRDTWTVSEAGVEQSFGYAPTYFPGTTNATEARRVALGVGQEVGAIDFSLVPGRTANVSGTVVDSHGTPVGGRNVGLSQEFRSSTSGMFFSSNGSSTQADGSFTIKNVAPGDYKIRASTSVPGKTPGSVGQEAVSVPIVVNGIDISNLVITTSSGWQASGLVTDEGGGVPTIARDRIRIAGRPVSGDADPRNGSLLPESGRVKDDWTFAAGPLYGAERLRVSLPDGWMVKAILHDGNDIADAVLDLKSGEELSGLHVVVSNKVTTVTGQLSDETGAPTTDGTVIVFAGDSVKWSEDSRFVRSARPDQQGQYQIKGLPAGDYLAVAVEYVQDGMWNDPEYLESIRRYGQRFTLIDGGSQAASLKIVKID